MSIPFSYLDDKQQPIGYSMDLCAAIVEEVKKELDLAQLARDVQALRAEIAGPRRGSAASNQPVGLAWMTVKWHSLAIASAEHLPFTVQFVAGRDSSAGSGEIPTIEELDGRAARIDPKMPRLLELRSTLALARGDHGRALTEAMAMGIPIAATNVNGVPELVIHGQTGLLSMPREPAQLAANIVWLLEHPGEAQAMTAKAIQAWLTVLDPVPARTIVIFTTTEDSADLFGQYDGPFRSRCKTIAFTNQGLAQVFAERARQIATAEC